MEYQCVDLDPNFELFHGENPPLLETNCLAEACGFVYERFKTTGIECAVYQPRTKSYREIYRQRNTYSWRDATGRFTK